MVFENNIEIVYNLISSSCPPDAQKIKNKKKY